MTFEVDIWRAANLLVQHHGPKAPIHAAMRADELLEAGDMAGLAVWKRIARAIDELLSTELPAGARVN